MNEETKVEFPLLNQDIKIREVYALRDLMQHDGWPIFQQILTEEMNQNVDTALTVTASVAYRDKSCGVVDCIRKIRTFPAIVEEFVKNLNIDH